MSNGLWHIYIVECSDGTLYTGATTDVDRRVHEHNSVDSKASRYVKHRRPATLVYSESGFASRSEAQKREYEIKQYSRSKKLKLVENGNK